MTTLEPRRPRRARTRPAARSSTRATCSPRIVHFGLGAFHRAHQAVYTEAAAARTGEPWGIAAVAPRSAAVAPMRAQDCLYSVTDLAPGAGDDPGGRRGRRGPARCGPTPHG